MSFVEADIFMMSYREMAQLNDAEGLDAVHFSEPLSRITKTCKFKGYQLAMYTDRDGYAKDLPDNKHDTHSYYFLEDLDAVFNEISDLTGGLVRRG